MAIFALHECFIVFSVLTYIVPFGRVWDTGKCVAEILGYPAESNVRA